MKKNDPPREWPEEKWKKLLSDEEYHVLREKGTEAPFSGCHLHHKEPGSYTCTACDALLFHSSHKYDSQSGWPSFWAPAHSNAVDFQEDTSIFPTRVEILCKTCGSHLGHVFEDGPPPTGLRFCLNSIALKFKK